MQQVFAKRIVFIFIAILVFSHQSNAMQEVQPDDSYKARLVQFISDHKVALATCGTAACALSIYVAYNCESKKKKIIKISTKTPIIYLKSKSNYLQNIEQNKTFVNSAMHNYPTAVVDEIDIRTFIERGRIFLVENKKQREVCITMVKIARSQMDLDTLETALGQQEKSVSIYSHYKNSDGANKGIVDCIIEHPKNIEFQLIDSDSEVLQEQ